MTLFSLRRFHHCRRNFCVDRANLIFDSSDYVFPILIKPSTDI